MFAQAGRWTGTERFGRSSVPECSLNAKDGARGARVGCALEWDVHEGKMQTKPKHVREGTCHTIVSGLPRQKHKMLQA